MTREEAIKELKWNKVDDTYVLSDEVIDMAISALPAEGEYIKKDDVIKYIDEMPSELTEDGRRMVRQIRLKEFVADLPTYSFPENSRIEYGTDGNLYEMSISNGKEFSFPEREKGEWIPASERLPEAYQKVLVTYEEFHWANEPTTYGVKLIYFGGIVDFIAWQPLPEPYKAEKTETCTGCVHPCVMYEPRMKACDKKGR